MNNAGAISATGMTAERMRMEVIANNLANAYTTRGVDGQPFRRQEVVFEAILDRAMSPGGFGGVRVAGVTDDPSPLQRVHMPGHPDADADDMVEMPNVSLPVEMVDLMTAMRAYEANLKVAQATHRMGEVALSIIRGV